MEFLMTDKCHEKSISFILEVFILRSPGFPENQNRSNLQSCPGRIWLWNAV